jgi:hypothetical protein
MLKNIEKMQHKGIPIKKGLVRWELVSVGIPPAILKTLGIRNPADRKRRGANSAADSLTKLNSSMKLNSDSNLTGINKSNMDISSSHQASLGQIHVSSLSD